ncbi:guided entry of tail-anchored proteins factor 1 [Phlebotomus argentipes]|uniref:guided entry of tail-anchored proteins factor 1 n=1 Tax=Phlebotomus argentipes TaxID=94469 RepID=UPI0028936B1A|nr:guided entry of tail-anchored proteins factor 1 [Phlebotomus argentipes]
MVLILIITSVSFILAFAHILTRPLVNCLNTDTKMEAELKATIVDHRRELRGISMRDEYPRYVRIERKIVVAEKKLNELAVLNSTSKMVIKYGVPYGTKAFLYILLIGISIYHRKTPVVVFDDRFDFMPLGTIMSAPTGIPGAISAPFWSLVSSFVWRTVAGLVKNT